MNTKHTPISRTAAVPYTGPIHWLHTLRLRLDVKTAGSLIKAVYIVEEQLLRRFRLPWSKSAR